MKNPNKTAARPFGVHWDNVKASSVKKKCHRWRRRVQTALLQPFLRRFGFLRTHSHKNIGKNMQNNPLWNKYKWAGFIFSLGASLSRWPNPPTPSLIFYLAPPTNSCGSSPSRRAGASTFAAVIKGLPIRASTLPWCVFVCAVGGGCRRRRGSHDNVTRPKMKHPHLQPTPTPSLCLLLDRKSRQNPENWCV